MFTSQIWTFIGIAALITITPGVDTMLVIRNVLARGRRSGLFTAGGICSGLFCHATRPAIRRGLESVTGVVLIAFEIRLAFEKR